MFHPSDQLRKQVLELARPPAVHIYATALDEATLLDVRHRVPGKRALSDAWRSDYAYEALLVVPLVFFGKEPADELLLQRVLPDEARGGRRPVPQLRLFHLEGGLPQLKVPIYIALVLLILRIYHEVLSFLSPMINLYGQLGNKEAPIYL